MTEKQRAVVLKWLAALRSGRYKKGRLALSRSKLGSNEVYHCCLGVLAITCRVPYKWQSYLSEKTRNYNFGSGNCREESKPPNGWFLSKTGLDPSLIPVLMRINDTNRGTFKTIADMIEKKIATESE